MERQTSKGSDQYRVDLWMLSGTPRDKSPKIYFNSSASGPSQKADVTENLFKHLRTKTKAPKTLLELGEGRACYFNLNSLAQHLFYIYTIVQTRRVSMLS